MELKTEMTDLELAYLAGLIDGEGCIGANAPRRHVRLGIVMSDKLAMSWIAEKLGKTLCVQRRSRYYKCKVTYRDLYSVNVVSQQAATLLRLLLPFLRTKRKQALVAIRLAELQGVNCHTGTMIIDNLEDQMYCVDMLRVLKKEDLDITLPEVRPQERPTRHGTRWGYQQGCRCEMCLAINKDHSMDMRNKDKIKVS